MDAECLQVFLILLVVRPADDFYPSVKGERVADDELLRMAVRNRNHQGAGPVYLREVKDILIPRVSVEDPDPLLRQLADRRVVIVNDEKRNSCHLQRPSDILSDAAEAADDDVVFNG